MESIDLERKLVLNPDYFLIDDSDRIVLISDRNSRYFFNFIHPMHAILLSFFKGDKSTKEVVMEISDFFSLSEENTLKTVSAFIENPSNIGIEYDDRKFIFPKNILIENKNNIARQDIDYKLYLKNPPYDFERIRFSKPTAVVFVINTSCVTDCIYCYANKEKKYKPLSTERILSIIDEAHKIGIRDFDITGGEIFLQKDWKIILEKLHNYGFISNLSTKVPLSKEMIDIFVQTGFQELQVSIDSFDTELQIKNLKVANSYADKMKESLTYLDSKGIKLIIKGTQTNDTLTTKNIGEVIDFIGHLKNVKRYMITVIGCSSYKSNEEYHKIKPTLKQIEEILNFINQKRKEMCFEIIFDDQRILKDELCNYSEFKERSLCSGNINGLIILPDGKVTICEELYWDEHFIIGDLTKNNLLEVWNSDKASNLWNLHQKDFPEESSCHSCQDFNNCRKGKGVCWKLIVKGYDWENYLYPDPRCPKAPELIYNICSD
ncbi:MAG: radical SAM protein [Dysgonamonadaceae bacterium]|jgi:radical SAM protein with 4Fe4S-binding SPASM domain|nr:radical SAM protein [Dysgonamonadaceae bacterium]